MRGARPFLAIVLGVSAFARSARAQVRWDVGAETGAERRVLTSKPPGQSDAGFGPMIEMQGHLALLPLVRVGAYAQFDTSPIDGLPSRDLFSAGLDVRLLFPWPRGNWRTDLRIGVGESATFAGEHMMTTLTGPALVPSTRGSFTEVPLALGAAYRVMPWFWVTAELGARPGFGFGGSTYRSPTPTGDDTLAVYLSLGVMTGR